MDKKSIFKKITVSPGETQTIPFGEKFILLKRTEGGWYVNVVDTPEGQDAVEGNYYHTGNSDSVVLAPALQEKPLVFKGNKIAVLPEQRMTFFLQIPVVLQIYHTRKKEENLLKEIPFKKLSDTWFGDAVNGEAAFSIGSDYSLGIPQLDPGEMKLICPVKVINNSKISLELQRLILRVNNLSIYECGNRLITDLIKIEYKGKDVISSVGYSFNKGIHGEKEIVAAKPRISVNSSPLKINFHFLKQMYKGV